MLVTGCHATGRHRRNLAPPGCRSAPWHLHPPWQPQCTAQGGRKCTTYGHRHSVYTFLSQGPCCCNFCHPGAALHLGTFAPRQPGGVVLHCGTFLHLGCFRFWHHTASSRTLAMPGCCCFAAYTFQQPLDSCISLYLSTLLHLNRANSPSLQPGTYNVALHLTSLILHLEKLKLHCFSRLWLQFAAALFGNSLFQYCIVLAQHLQYLQENVLQ